MSKDIVQADIGARIVDNQGRPTQEFYDTLTRLIDLEILNGEGSPEGKENAPRKTLYWDETTNDIYIKTTNADDNTGWVLTN